MAQLDPNEKVSVTLTRIQWNLITQAIWQGLILPGEKSMPLINAIAPQLEGNTELREVKKAGNSKVLSPADD